MNDMNKTREEGFYRVKYKGPRNEWTICWWQRGNYPEWIFIGQEHTTFSDDQFAEIDENRINCTPEPKTEVALRTLEGILEAASHESICLSRESGCECDCWLGKARDVIMNTETEADGHSITPEPKTEVVKLADGVHVEVDPNIKTLPVELSDGSTIEVEI